MSSEVSRVLDVVSQLPNVLTRYGFLMHLLRYDEALFFSTVRANIPFLMPLIYTPLVGEACQHYSELKLPPRGLIIGYDKAGSIKSVLQEYRNHTPKVEVIVVTDGARILGLGDLGANGHGIPVGKLLLYSACGGVHPSRCLPITLDVGSNTESVTSNPSYFGLKQKRVRGQQYDEFVDEFMRAVVDVFGANCLVQFEDFGNDHALTVLNRYRDHYCCFNDDIQGTAAVALAGIFSALRVDGINNDLDKHRFLFMGAGSAGIGIASLIVRELVKRGIRQAEASRCCWFFDSRGLVYGGRANVSSAKAPFAHVIDDSLRAVADKVGGGGFEAIVKHLKPTGIIGVSTVAGAFTPGVLRKMAAINNESSDNKRPIVFALSNPVSKSECTAEEAYLESDGRAVFASGSPFSTVTLPDGTSRIPGQGNNVYCFPGIGMGIVAAQSRRVTDDMLLIAAKTVGDLVTPDRLAVGCVYPPTEDLLSVSRAIALAVANEAIAGNLADVKIVTETSIDKLIYHPHLASGHDDDVVDLSKA